MLWKDFMPKYRVLSIPGGLVSSFRWGPIRWDSMKSPKGFTFAQYGEKPAMFICRTKGSSPLFLQGVGWDTKYISKRGSVRIGKTRKPLNFSWIWKKEKSNASRTCS